MKRMSLKIRGLAITGLQILNLALSSWGWAEESLPPIQPPQGLYVYQNKVNPVLYRISKRFNHNDPQERALIADYKSKGFVCFRRSQKETLCQQKNIDFQVPPGTEARVGSQLEKYPIFFSAPERVELSHNGSTTKEWMVYAQTLIGQKKVNFYRISKPYEGNISIAFPADPENPISFLTVYSELILGFRMILQGQDQEGWTHTYYIDALYSPMKKDSKTESDSSANVTILKY